MNPAPYTTVASIIKNLEKKGYLSSRLVGNVYLYKPLISDVEYKKKFMGKVVKEYFDNSYKELVNFFVAQKKLSAKELKEIIHHDRKRKQLIIKIFCYAGFIYLYFKIIDQPRRCLSLLPFCTSQAHILYLEPVVPAWVFFLSFFIAFLNITPLFQNGC